MRFAVPVAGPIVLVVAALVGCNGSPFFAQQNSPWPVGQSTPDAQQAQLEELSRRISQLDANNRELHTEVARYRQDLEKERQLRLALQRQLDDTATQLSELQQGKAEAEQRLAAMLASARQRGGARIRANNSLQLSLPEINLPGVQLRREADVIRIEIPADQLFIPNSDQLRAGADQLIDEVAAVISRQWPRQMIGIEGHTDSMAGSTLGMTPHQLAASQAMAVFNQIVRSGRLAARQLFTMSHGANHPRFSNADPAGRAKNRRIEIVIYPETIDGS